jgi:hypothetical protein
MRRRRIIHALALCLAAVTLVTPAEGAPDGELVVICHPSRKDPALDARALYFIFTGATRNWPDSTPLVPFNLPLESPVRAVFDRAVLKMTNDQVARFWVDQRVRGTGRAPRQAPDATVAMRLVAKLPEAISYVPASSVNASVRVLARIRNGKVMNP